jgi:hypothetical protein
VCFVTCDAAIPAMKSEGNVTRFGIWDELALDCWAGSVRGLGRRVTKKLVEVLADKFAYGENLLWVCFVMDIVDSPLAVLGNQGDDELNGIIFFCA